MWPHQGLVALVGSAEIVETGSAARAAAKKQVAHERVPTVERQPLAIGRKEASAPGDQVFDV